MEVAFSLTELKEKLGGSQEYVKIEIFVGRYYNDCELKVYAKPIKPLDLVVPPTYLGNIIASEVGNQRYKASLDKIDKILIKKGIVEEAPQVYKDIDEVVRVSHEAGIGNLVARLVPLAVIKG